MSFKLVGSANYAASVVKLGAPHKIPKADRLQAFTVFGQSVITGLNQKEGDLVVFFPAESQLSPKLLSGLNLYRDKTMNSDQEKVGYFENHGRIKALKLRETWSTAFIIPVADLLSVYAGAVLPAVGEPFDHTCDDAWICQKYYPRRNPGRGLGGQQQKKCRESRIVPGQFAFHYDTAQLGRNLTQITDTVCELTEKMHGTSVVISKVLVKKQLPWYLSALRWMGVPILDADYDLIYSSRKVIKNDVDYKGNHYYSDDIWGLAVKTIGLFAVEQGITLYAEIVGYLPSGEPIQSVGGQVWDYGCRYGEHKLFVYRITHTSPDGTVIEFTPEQISSYCEWKGLSRVPILTKIAFSDCHESNEKLLKSLTDIYCTGPCDLCQSGLPREGFVARIIQKEGKPIWNWSAFKNKSLEFLGKETNSLDAGTENIEDNQDGAQ